MQKEQITGQVIDIKLSVDDALMETGFSLTFKPDYNLTEAEFKDLNSPPRTWDWLTSGLFLFGVGLLLTCFSRYLAYIYFSASKVETYEWICGVISICLAVFSCVIGCVVDNPKKEVMNQIKNHFSNVKPVKQFVSKRD